MPITINGSTGIAGIDGSAGTPALQGSDTNTGIAFGADVILASTGGTERWRVDSAGRLLVGTSTARTNFYGTIIQPQIQVETASSATRSLSVVSSSSADAGGLLVLASQKSNAVGGNTAVASGNELGQVGFLGSDGTNFIPGAVIQGIVDGTPGANDMPGRLVFSTTADGASSPTERMRIKSDGSVLIGCTGFNNDSPDTLGGFIRQDNGNIKIVGTNIFQFYNSVGQVTAVGSITTSASATTYATSSDYRLKENIVPLTGAIERLQQIPVHRFSFITEPDKTVDGFLAHEAQAVVPECATGAKDEVDADGKPLYQGIDQSKLVPLLTAALQEAIGRIETLEAEVAALKAS